MRDVIIKDLFGVVIIFAVCSCGAQQHPGGGSGIVLQEAGCQFLKECAVGGKTAYSCVEGECRMCDVMPNNPKCIVVTPKDGSRLIWCCPPDIDYSTIMSGDTFKQFYECVESNKGSETTGVEPQVKPEVSQEPLQPELRP